MPPLWSILKHAVRIIPGLPRYSPEFRTHFATTRAMRLIHTADLHLDSPFAGRTKEIRRRLHDASREALRSVVDLALRERADAVVIAGDLFDGAGLSFGTERFLLEQLARLAQQKIATVYATGNHDAAAKARRAVELEWPQNVLVAAGPKPRRLTVLSRDGNAVGAIVAAGHHTDRETSDLSAAFRRTPSPLPEVAVLHTQVRDARYSEHHGLYAPSELSRLKSSGFDAWLLGHVHQWQVLSDAPLICYSGSPQGRGFGEPGPRGCLLVDLADRRAPFATFHETSPLRFTTLRVDGLGAARSVDSVVRAVRGAWDSERAIDPAPGVEWIVRVELEGPTPLAHLLRRADDLDSLREDIEASLDVRDVELWAHRTHTPVRVADHAGRDDALGEALRLVQGLLKGTESFESLRPTPLAGLDAAEGDEEDNYLRDLLDGASAELLVRMLREGPEQ